VNNRLLAIEQVLTRRRHSRPRGPTFARLAFPGGSRGCVRGQPRRRDGGKDAIIVAVFRFQAQPVISHLPNSGQITAVACPAMNSTRCLSSSESTITCGFPDRLLPFSISRTVLSKKWISCPQSHSNDDGISLRAMLALASVRRGQVPTSCAQKT